LLYEAALACKKKTRMVDNTSTDNETVCNTDNDDDDDDDSIYKEALARKKTKKTVRKIIKDDA
jgi:hypothetical protein